MKENENTQTDHKVNTEKPKNDVQETINLDQYNDDVLDKYNKAIRNNIIAIIVPIILLLRSSNIISRTGAILLGIGILVNLIINLWHRHKYLNSDE